MTMGKIASMMLENTDPLNITKRVYWRPVTSTTVLKVGQPVCYNSDEVKDYRERTAHPDTSTAYAAGNQEFNARIFCVEEPLTANLDHFAGIAVRLGDKAGEDGDLIEIATPVEGAMVPVYTDENCTEERTILGIRTGEASVSYPGRPIGIAQETKNRSGGTSDGMVWMKFRNFEYLATNGAGDATANSLIIDDEAAANAVCIKSMNLKFSGTGRARGLYYVGDISGLGHSMYGMFKFRTYVSAALVSNKTVHCLAANLIFRDSATIVNSSGTWNSAIYATVETETAGLTLSGGSVAGISLEYYVDETGAAPANAFAIYVHASTANWDGLLAIRNSGDCGDVGTAKSGDGSGSIPIWIMGTTYWLQYWDAAS